MNKLKEVFSHHKNKDDVKDDAKTTEQLYKDHPKDLEDAYRMGNGDLAGEGGPTSSVAGLSGAAASGNVYERNAIPKGTGLTSGGKPTWGDNGFARPEGSEAFDEGDPTSAYQGLDATAAGTTAHRQPRDEVASYPLETATHPVEGSHGHLASRIPASTTGNLGFHGTEDDAASITSIKSGVLGHNDTSALTGTSGLSSSGTGVGLTGAALTDRSVDQYGQSAQDYSSGTSHGLGASSGYTGTSSTGTGTGFATSSGLSASSGYDIPPSGVPHTTFTGNRLDPNFKETVPTFHEEDGHFHDGSGSHTHSHSHIGRNAALGGAGVAGIGAYELGKERSSTQTGPASNTLGPHDSNLKNVLDPRVQPDSQKLKAAEEERSTGTGHHYGRDAAAVGGAGALGAGAYEYEKNKHHDEKHDSDRKQSKSGGLFGFLHKDKSSVDDEPVHTQPRKSHITGRDTEVVAGAGVLGAGAAYEADKHHHDNTTSTFGGTKATDENIHHGRDQFDQDAAVPRRGSVLGATQGGVVAPIGESFDSRDPTSASTSGHHYGRDAAVVGGAGALGVGAYESTSHSGIASGVGSTGGYAERMPVTQDTTSTHDTTSGKQHGLSSLLHRDHPNKLHKDPPSGKYANAQTTDDGRIIEPRTGLPMNVEKYGSGTGGTDGNNSIAYDQSAEPAAWDKVHKLNTPY